MRASAAKRASRTEHNLAECSSEALSCASERVGGLAFGRAQASLSEVEGWGRPPSLNARERSEARLANGAQLGGVLF